MKSNFGKKPLKRKVTCLEKQVEMVDKKKVQQLELLTKNNTEKKYLKIQEALAKTEAALEKANMSKNEANEKICEMRLTIKNLEKENKKLSGLNTSLTSSLEMLEKEQYINLEMLEKEQYINLE